MRLPAPCSASRTAGADRDAEREGEEARNRVEMPRRDHEPDQRREDHSDSTRRLSTARDNADRGLGNSGAQVRCVVIDGRPR